MQHLPYQVKEVARQEVVAAFARNYKRLKRYPSESDCYRLTMAINNVRRAPKPETLNATLGYAERLAAHSAISRLAAKRVEKLRKLVPSGVSLPHLVDMEALVEALALSRDAFLGADPLAGTRAGAEWHRVARYLAPFAMHALERVGKKVSFEKGGPFVNLMADALKLAGQGRREPAAISKALKSGLTIESWGGSKSVRLWVGIGVAQTPKGPNASNTTRRPRRST